MPNVTYIDPDGTERVLNVPVGSSVMQAAIANGIDGIVAECGGSMMCATCHVYVDPSALDRLPPMSSIENEMLDCTRSERLPNSRLSCQLVATPEFDGLVVRLPENQI